MKAHVLALVVLAVAALGLDGRAGALAQGPVGAGQVGVGSVGPLRSIGRISGVVTVAGRGGAAGLDVYIPGTSYVAKTASDGSYVLRDVPEGSYSLQASAPGFAPANIGPVRVRALETTKAPALSLAPSPSSQPGGVDELGRRVQALGEEVQALRAVVDRLRALVEQRTDRPVVSPPQRTPEPPAKGRKCDPSVPRYAQPGCVE